MDFPLYGKVSAQEFAQQRNLVEAEAEKVQQAWTVEKGRLRPLVNAAPTPAAKLAVLNEAARGDVGLEFEPEGLSEIGQSIFKDMVRRERLLVLKPFYAEVIG